jgi:hypothetical protein
MAIIHMRLTHFQQYLAYHTTARLFLFHLPRVLVASSSGAHMMAVSLAVLWLEREYCTVLGAER